MPLTLGAEPDHLDVILVPGADFAETVETLSPDQTSPQPWPIGTVLTLEFSGGILPGTVVWTANVTTNIVTWNVQSEAVDGIIGGGYSSVGLWYENGDVRLPLALGKVSIYG